MLRLGGSQLPVQEKCLRDPLLAQRRAEAGFKAVAQTTWPGLFVLKPLPHACTRPYLPLGHLRKRSWCVRTCTGHAHRGDTPFTFVTEYTEQANRKRGSEHWRRRIIWVMPTAAQPWGRGGSSLTVEMQHQCPTQSSGTRKLSHLYDSRKRFRWHSTACRCFSAMGLFFSQMGLWSQMTVPIPAPNASAGSPRPSVVTLPTVVLLYKMR